MTATYIFHSEFLWTVISQMHESESITVAITPSLSLSARQFAVEVDPRGLDSGAHYAEVLHDVIILCSLVAIHA